MKRFLCIFLAVIVVSVHLFAGVSFAYSVPAGVSDIETVISNQLAIDRITSVCEVQSVTPIVVIYVDYRSDGSILFDCYIFSYESVIITRFSNNRIYVEAGYTLLDGFVYSSLDSTLYDMNASYLPGGSPLAYNGSNYYAFGSLGQSYPVDSDIFYCSVDWGNLVSLDSPLVSEDYNLDISSVLPDDRYFEIFKDEYRGNEYVAFRCSDSGAFDAFTYVEFYFTDFSGSYTRTIIDDDYFSISPDETFLTLIVINPDLIYSGEFTLTGGVYHGSSGFGDFTFSCSLVFNENPLDDSPPSDSYYFSNFYEYHFNQGGDTSRSYNVLNASFTYEAWYDSLTLVYDDNMMLVQPFSFSWIMIPHSHHLSVADFITVACNSFDVVIYDVPVSVFDSFYYNGAASDLEQLSSIDDFYYWYTHHLNTLIVPPYSFLNGGGFANEYHFDAALYIDYRFFFKQVGFLIGDTDSILTEFSERFYEQDGFSDKLFDSLYKLWDNDYSFYDSALSVLQRVSYWINDWNALDWQGLLDDVSDCLGKLNDISSYLYTIKNYLPLIDGRLVSMDSYLSSMDSDSDNILSHVSSLDTDLDDVNRDLGLMGGLLSSSDSYLATISSDVGSLLSMFDGEDFDIEITLPQFDFSYIVDIYGGDLGDFASWINDLVVTLPEFDFTDFPDFASDSDDMVDDFAGQFDDLLGSLELPYSYQDSGVSYFGWD